ncbi:TPA: hypothetical protein ACQN8F_000084 [Streptococcus pyogenes]|uniref:hypothetical protein n=1 Tax=Streptococcus pyogenes TaxID=1314 RepID=UPI0010EFC1FD|nr:hypothetical protein [Streptococcus pyogenes]VHC25297.1 Uncharacterised protein [Streptococcus pyogenes]VHC79193.1 Uncharacterised protein [Streptococcus pyogenes]VHD90181.1 Uncharacterised protein [Streptococcus pyogenes]VHG47194.1 Uncharacterised protein [Streptococcus pyogenes]
MTTFLVLFIASAVYLISRPVSADLTSQVDRVTQFDQSSWEKDRESGYEKGFENGKNGYGPNVSRNAIPVPEGIQDSSEYKDGYQQGYSEGWHQEHPLLGVVFDFFVSIWDVMSDLFNEVS